MRTLRLRRADRDRRGDQRAVVVEVGGGLRSFTVGGRDVLDGYGADEMCTVRARPGADPVAEPARGREYEFDGRQHQLPLTEPEHANAIHGLVRWAAWSVGEREPDRVVMEHVLRPQPGYPFTLALAHRVRALGARSVGADDRDEHRFRALPVRRRCASVSDARHATVDPLELRAPGRTVLHLRRARPPHRLRGRSTERSSTSASRERSARRSSTTPSRTSSRRRRPRPRASSRPPDAAARCTLWVDEGYRYVMVFTGDPLRDVDPAQHRGRADDLPAERVSQRRVRVRTRARRVDRRARGGSRRRERRPAARVLILGGGFAGVGAAQKLKDADAEVVLVDRHDYHTFQPLLYQLATGLLETTGGRALAARPARAPRRTRPIHKATVTGVDLDARQVSFDGLAPISYDYLVFGLGAEVNFFGTEGAAEHAFPMYTLPHAVRLKDHLLERWEAADRDPSLVEDGALNVVVVGGGPTGVETAGALAELYRGNFASDYPDVAQDEGADRPGRGRARSCSRCSSRSCASTPRRRSRSARVEVKTGDRRRRRSRRRGSRSKSGEELKAHTLVWGAGLQGNELVQSLGLELQRGNRIGVGPGPHAARPPRGVRARRRRRDHGREDRAGAAPARIGRAPVGRARRRDDRPPDRRQGREAVRVQATRARWRRSAAARRSCRCSAAGR